MSTASPEGTNTRHTYSRRANIWQELHFSLLQLFTVHMPGASILISDPLCFAAQMGDCST